MRFARTHTIPLDTPIARGQLFANPWRGKHIPARRTENRVPMRRHFA
jgi:hypothetical protein